MKKIILLLLLVSSSLFSTENNTTEEKTIKVVYDLTTNNLKNFERKILKAIVANKAHYEASLKELEVTVVIHGEAYKFFIINPQNSIYHQESDLIKAHNNLAKRIKSMVENYEVKFVICEIGMKTRKIKKSDIYSFVKIIPNSMIGLIDRQNEGYAYLPVGD